MAVVCHEAVGHLTVWSGRSGDFVHDKQGGKGFGNCLGMFVY